MCIIIVDDHTDMCICIYTYTHTHRWGSFNRFSIFFFVSSILMWCVRKFGFSQIVFTKNTLYDTSFCLKEVGESFLIFLLNWRIIKHRTGTLYFWHSSRTSDAKELFRYSGTKDKSLNRIAYSWKKETISYRSINVLIMLAPFVYSMNRNYCDFNGRLVVDKTSPFEFYIFGYNVNLA